MNEDCIVIGVDPGSYKLGFAILERQNGIVLLIRSGVVSFKKSDSLSKKLLQVFLFFEENILFYLLEKKNIYFSLEDQFLGKNFRSSSILVSFNSVLLLLSEKYCLGTFIRSPCEIKKIICGYGGAAKETVHEVLLKQYGFDLPVYSFDESDAMAIALSCFLADC